MEQRPEIARRIGPVRFIWEWGAGLGGRVEWGLTFWPRDTSHLASLSNCGNLSLNINGGVEEILARCHCFWGIESITTSRSSQSFCRQSRKSGHWKATCSNHVPLCRFVVVVQKEYQWRFPVRDCEL